MRLLDFGFQNPWIPIMRFSVILALLALAGCGGLAWNTDVASTPASRLAMAMSVEPGITTETGFVTRWGHPVQKVREGGQTDFIYRNALNVEWHTLPQFGDSNDYVIVTFQYGLATGVRTSDGIACRGSFMPRPPGYGFDNPTTVRLIGTCPLSGLWNGSGQSGLGETDTLIRNPVREDAYVPDGAGVAK
jgi:hypothetical protein